MAHEESSSMFPFQHGKRERKRKVGEMNEKASKREVILENSGTLCIKVSNQPHRNTYCTHSSRD